MTHLSLLSSLFFLVILASFLCHLVSFIIKEYFVLIVGVILAILEKADLLPEFYSDGAKASTGTVSAGYQNFLICVEMFFASLALRYAFPYQVGEWFCSNFHVSIFTGYNIHSLIPQIYEDGYPSDGHVRSVTMQSISSSLKETVNPKDMLNDAIHNFHPQYQQYTQYHSSAPSVPPSGSHSSKQNQTNEGKSFPSRELSSGHDTRTNEDRISARKDKDHYSKGIINPGLSLDSDKSLSSSGEKSNSSSRPLQTISQNYSEKTNLLNSDDESQWNSVCHLSLPK